MFLFSDCYESSTQFEGNDVKPGFKLTKAQIGRGAVSSCKKECKNQPGCKYFSVKYLKSAKFCYLKTSHAGRRVSSGFTSGVAHCNSSDGYN